jgi:uncharacterized protein YeaC (DUF1315 family)
MKNIFKFWILVALALSCHSKNSEQKKENISEDKNTVKQSKDSIFVQSTFYDDVARFIAGLTPTDTSQFHPLTQTKKWTSYAKKIDSSWSSFQTKKMKVIREWKEKYIDTLIKPTDTVFYPFSGPDFSYMYAFFPRAKTYLMVALEPVGKIPDLHEIKNNLNAFFSALNQAIYDNLSLSFFKTKSMKVQLQNKQIEGTLPILMFFIARHNLRIIDIKPFDIDKDGKMIFSNDSSFHPNHKFSHGVQITFYHPQWKIKQTLYYLSFSIRNDGFQAYPEGEKFLRSLPNHLTTFVKSSSYCMHFDEYNKIRDIILQKSKNIIQDDSGIPYKFLSSSGWTIHFFGKYTKPIPLFANHYQPELEKVPSKVDKIPFRFGYNTISFIFVATKN